MKDKLPHRLPNPQIQGVALEYYHAFEVLAERHQHALEAGHDPGFYLPLLNAAAITVELYLKSLAARDVYYPDGPPTPPQKQPEAETVKFGEPYRRQAKPVQFGHKPAALLRKLPNPKARPKGNPIRRQLIAAFRSSSLSLQTNSFTELLKQYDDLFQYSRYAFEEGLFGRNYPLDPLSELVRFLHTFVEEMAPTFWEESEGP